ncbi:hypothetical protein BDA96_08G010900 [Sorghum bicolor]|uniref:Uncharacterized protein n=1 Tax=Sorghum bicolor TaxID=4558 RepID=A0A921QCW0_SORBI|nr:hypothetical protein BDA96_08G010900 [Sorghum bicolor]
MTLLPAPFVVLAIRVFVPAPSPIGHGHMTAAHASSSGSNSRRLELGIHSPAPSPRSTHPSQPPGGRRSPSTAQLSPPPLRRRPWPHAFLRRAATPLRSRNPAFSQGLRRCLRVLPRSRRH